MQRFRKYRINQEIRDKYAEISLQANDFIYPYFVVDGQNIYKPITSLHGVYHFSIDQLLKDIELTLSSGITKFLLFGLVDEILKDELGIVSYSKGNLISRAVEKIKAYFPEALIITDICLCAYTNHGHCGLINGADVDNDPTLPLLAKMALSHSQAGADFVAPSAMMDGQVAAIKKILNEHSASTKILSYSVKYASGYYGPFRDAVSSTPSFGDRKSYQMDYRTIKQSVAEVNADIKEGADWVMVKPAHTYLDIIHRIKTAYSNIPLVAYQVSGEYMMIKAAASAGYLNEELAMLEALTAIKRAGANYIISYYAKDFIRKGL